VFRFRQEYLRSALDGRLASAVVRSR